MSTVISVLASCANRMKEHKPFSPIENKAFYEFIQWSCRNEENTRMRLNLLQIKYLIYDEKKTINKSEEIWLLAYLEGALLSHDVFV